MPRTTKVPTYSLHKPSGRAVVKIPEDGKQRSIYLGEYGSDESRENYARVVADILAGRTVRPPVEIKGTATLEPSITVGELAERFEKHSAGYYRKNGKATSEVATIRCAMKFLTASHADLPAAEFSIGALKAIRQSMMEKGICRDSINRHDVGRIRRAFRWGATEELIPPAVPQSLALLPGLKAGRSEARDRPPVKPADETIVKKALRELSPTVRAMVEIASYRQAANRGCERAFPAPKGLSGEKLNAWPKRHQFYPNMLRDSFGTEVRREHDLELAQLLLGHASKRTTETYAEPDMARGIEAIKRIG